MGPMCPDEGGIALDTPWLSMLGVRDSFTRKESSYFGDLKGGEECPFSKEGGGTIGRAPDEGGMALCKT